VEGTVAAGPTARPDRGSPSDRSNAAGPPAPGSTADRAFHLLLALLGFVLVGWAIGALCRAALTRTDLRFVVDIASDRTSGQIAAAHAFSLIGSGYVVFPATAICAVGLYLRQRRSWALAVVLSAFGAAMIADVDKVLAGRARPPVHHLEHVVGASFPSGHATQSAALCTALVLVLYVEDLPRWLKIAAAVASFLLVLGVAESRVYLGVHYPSDVLGGVLLGAAWSVTASRVVTAPLTLERRAGPPTRGRRARRAKTTLGRVLVVLVSALGTLTAAAFLDQLSWIFEEETLFNLQYAELLVVAALLAAGLRRWRLGAVAVLLATINVVLIAPCGDAPPSSAAPGDPRLRIVALNLDATNSRFGELAPMIRRLKPDILGLTEVTPGWARSAEHASSRVRPRLVVEQPGDYGLALASADRPAAIGAERFPADGPVALVARFSFAGRPMTFVLVHLHTPFAGSVHARELDALAAARRDFGPRLVICGDFNTVPWSGQLRTFADSAHLTAAFAGLWPPWTWPTWSWLLRTPIDHCLVSDGLAVLRRHVGPNIGSDHFSLVIDIAVTALHR
jgi:endonuclease/exonuclease/phosphatase (EEP) superfamily protein YafD/membrane-associated phospholipid phosphatase